MWSGIHLHDALHLPFRMVMHLLAAAPNVAPLGPEGFSTRSSSPPPPLPSQPHLFLGHWRRARLRDAEVWQEVDMSVGGATVEEVLDVVDANERRLKLGGGAPDYKELH